MKTKLCDLNPAAPARLPAHTEDKSGIGVQDVDAYLKPIRALRHAMDEYFHAKGRIHENQTV
jgi:hypothetical protein